MTTATLQAKAEKALKSAIRKLVQERKKTGEPLYIWRNGKVIKFYPGRTTRS